MAVKGRRVRPVEYHGMKYTFLRQSEGNKRLVIIATGWSTGPALYESLELEGWDILVCHAYHDFSFPTEILENYTTIYLFAWSLGVAASEKAFGDSPITAAFAINGTPDPVSDEKGIPTDIFIGTAVGLSERNLQKFQKRMCGSATEYLNVANRLRTDESIEELRSQLLLFAKTAFDKPRLPWRRIFISQNDAIFPASNQKAAWEDYSRGHSTEIMVNEGSHFADISSFVRSQIADLAKVARSFSASHEKYPSSAIAQKKIAEHLASLIPDLGNTPVSALEIGPGAGVFTRLFRPKLELTHLHLVDIYDISTVGFRGDETFIKADAEQWIESAGTKWDIILSSSSIQWFANLRRFFENIREHLTPGGHLVCSTFLAGNLEQLDSLRPAPLLYLGQKEIEEMISEIFDGYFIESEDITLEFDTPRKALLHLKDTGVAGVGASGKTVAKIIKALPPPEGEKVRLTYKPVYIHAWVNAE